jgi:prepilin peptidase CpaA
MPAEPKVFQQLILLVLLLIGTTTDLRQRKIYNWLTFPGMCLGCLWNALQFADHGAGLLFGLKGAVLAIALFFLPFALGGLGAGDIKLLGVVGAFGGWQFAVRAGLWSALAGGVIALTLLFADKAARRDSRSFFRGLAISLLYQGQLPEISAEQKNKGRRFPYSLAILLGTVAALFFKA